MFKFLSTLFTLSLCVLVTSSIIAQNSWVPAAYQYLQDKDENFDLKVSDFNSPVVSDEYTSRGNNYTYYNQQYNGIPIFGKSLTVASTDEELRYASHNYISLEQYTKLDFNAPLDGNQILQMTAPIAGLSYDGDFQQSETRNEFNIRGFSSISPEKIFIEKAYVEVGTQLVPTWLVGIFHNDISKWWQYQINANTGELIDKLSWTIECEFEHHCDENHTVESHYKPMIVGEAKTHTVAAPGSMMTNTYEVFAAPLFSPLYGDRTIESTPWSPALNASPFGWHDDNGIAGAEYTVTRGNNVRAVEDGDANNNGGYSPDGGASLDFQFPFDPTDAPADYQDAAIVNLFYWNNILHDIFYQYGFDEASGNFQENNYGNGGNQSDMVNADAQDGSGTNNANFSTPPDGSNPRMQMYVWTVPNTSTFEVTSPSNIAGSYFTTAATFGPSTGTYSGELIEAVPAQACSLITNASDISGNIAVIDRGNCTFVSKVQEAQDAGAIAVIICNNVPGNPITMNGTGTGINIPAVMLSEADCDIIKAEIPTVEVEFTLNDTGELDSDMDNSVIAHEYGHGISIRLTGGPSNSSCLSGSEQMGEGWSDWLGLVTSIEVGDDGIVGKGVGSYLVAEPPTGNGIRTYPYSTDMSINQHTYDDIKTESVPHGVGTVWAAMLWEMTWGLIDVHGFDSDLYDGTGGNNIAMALVVEGLKLQPCNPGFVDGRDAILAADDILYGGSNNCLIWNAFAKRGLGVSAIQGTSGSRSDGTEAFDVPAECDGEFLITKDGAFQASVGDTYNYQIEATNLTAGTATSVEIEDVLPTGLDYVQGSLSMGTESNGTITVSQGTLAANASVTFDFDVQVNTSAPTSTLNIYEDFEYDYSEWNSTSGQGSDAWAFSTSNPYRGTGDYFVPNTANNNSQYLTIENLVLDDYPVFAFYHYFDTELNKDGGMVEISTDGGSTWLDLGARMYVNGYTGTLANGSNNDIDNREAFTGVSGGYIRTMIDLIAYANNTVDIRFFFGSDDDRSDDGWYIDDIMLYDGVVISNTACVTSAQGFAACNVERTIILPACELYNRYFNDDDNDGFGSDASEIIACAPSGNQVANADDCDDTDASINPGASEICDGIDQNCNNIIDENCNGGTTCVVEDSEDLEAGWGIWIDGGLDCLRTLADAAFANSGSYCVRLRDNTLTSNVSTPSLDLSTYETVQVDVSFITVNYGTGDQFHIESSDDGGFNWSIVETYDYLGDILNNVRYNESVIVNGPFTSNTRFRFRNDAPSNSRRVYVDDFLIEGCSTGSGGSTCNDGIQNGNETGIDCGGPDCAACPTCNDGVMNGNETGIDCGGPDCAACDSCNDGIQNGNETGIDCGGPDCAACPTCNDGVMNGGETGIDCGGPDCAACDSCNDGVMNGNETGVDCGGPDCPACPTGGACTDLDNESYEAGFGNWVDGGSDCVRSANDVQYANTGTYCIRLRDNSTTSHMTSASFDYSSYDSVRVSLSYIAIGMAVGDAFHVELSSDDGATWTGLKTWNFSVDFVNNVRGDETISVVAPLSSTSKVRIRCDANANGDRVYIDDVVIEGCDGSGGGPTCTDGIMNGNETGIDCGGPDCTACDSCTDGIMNGNETGIDCGGPDCPACDTCTDGIMNGNETGIDCGGPDCPACPTGNDCNELDNEGFEVGYGIWNDGGSDCVRSGADAQYANTGTYCIRLRDNTTSSVMVSNTLDYSTLNSLTIDFSFITILLNDGHTFYLEISGDDGSTWSVMESWEFNIDIVNNQRYDISILDNGPFTATTKIRFRSDFDINSDRVFIDDVILNGCGPNTLDEQDIDIDALVNGSDTNGNQVLTDNVDYQIFPNPNNGEFNLIFENDIVESNIKIVALDGSVIYDQIVQGKSHQLIIDQLESGMYLCIVNNGKEQITKKFIVR